MQRRKVTYKLYASVKQALALKQALRMHKDLWNAALEERIDAWRKFKKSISYEDQCASLTQIRAEMPEDWATVNCSSQQITLRRLDKAFKAFFARCTKGQTPGFPRFKSIARMPGFGFKGHGDGWRFSPKEANAGPDGKGRPDDFGVVRWSKHGSLRLQGIGHIKCRGEARASGVIKSCELLHSLGPQGDEWHMSVTLECADADVARARKAHHAMAADWGVSKLLTIVRTDGIENGTHREVVDVIENPRWFKTNRERLVTLNRAVSAKKRGGKNWRKASAVRGAFRSKIARKRFDFGHQVTSRIAARCSIFATEKLSIKNMMGSAAGTVEEPGKNVAQKRGLNREIGDTGGASLFQMLAYKVPETGAQYLEAPTGKLKPSQRCPECGAVAKKVLALRWHCCAACGHEEDRDSASARVVLRWALGTLPQEEKTNKKIRGQELPKAA